MGFFRRLEGAEGDQSQRRFWIRLIVLVLLGAYVVAFIIENRKQVGLHFVFATASVSLIWLILLSVAIGIAGGILLPQLAKRRAQKSGSS